MLKIMRWEDYPSDVLAVSVTGKKYLEVPRAAFAGLSNDKMLSTDPWFKRILKEVDRADLVGCAALDPYTGNSHSFDRVSTGVKTLWLMYHYPDRFLYASQWLGENCYQAALDAGAEKDIVVFDDSKMLCRMEGAYYLDNCRGQFQDFKRGTIYTLIPGGRVAWDFYLLEDDECDSN